MKIEVDASSIRPNHSAGVELFTYGVLNGIAASTSEPLVVTVQDGTVSDWRLRVPSDRIIWITSALPFSADNPAGQRLRRWTPGWARRSRAVRTCLNLVRSRSMNRHEGADVVLFPSSHRPIPRVPSVLVLHDLRSFTKQFRYPGLAATIRANVARASAIVVTWPHPYEQALEMFPAAAERIALIPTPAFQSAAEPSGAHREPGLLLYPSSTAPHKNHDTLLDAMALLPECRLICPGPLAEPDASRLLARAAQPDLRDRVSFPGFVSSAELAELYERTDAVVIPSLWEAASGAMLEAFSWGVPIVCADVAPLRAQLKFSGSDAGVFRPRDPESLAETVRAVLNNRSHYADSARRAGERLSERTWEATGRDYLDVLSWVADGRSGPVPRSEYATRLAMRRTS